MATPATLVATYQTTWSSNSSPASTSVTTAVGDVLVCVATSEDASTTLATPAGGTGLTWTLRQSVVVSSYTTAYVWTATATTAETFTMTITATGGGVIGFAVRRYSGSDGYDSSSKTNVSSGAPSLALTTTTDNCAIVVINSDWAAVDGTTRTWRTVNSITPTAGNGGEINYYRNASIYATYAASWSDAGTAGSKTVGLSAPSGQKYSIVACAIKGAAGGGPTPISVADGGSSAEAVTVAATVPLTDAASSAEALTAAASAPLADTASASDALTAAAAAPLADGGTAADSLTVTVAAPLADAGSAAEVLVTPTRQVNFADSGAAAEALAVAAAIPLADAASAADAVDNGLGTNKGLADGGSAADSLSVTVTVALADAGAGADSPTAAGAIPLADTAAATDALATPARTIPLADAGAAAETLGATATVPLADGGSAADSLDNGTGTLKPVGDTGSAADALSVTVVLALADAGTASDSPATGAAIPLADSGAAGQTFTATATVPLADTASAAEALTAAVAVSLADAGHAVDTAIGQDVAFVFKFLNDAGSAADSLTFVPSLITGRPGVTGDPLVAAMTGDEVATSATGVD